MWKFLLAFLLSAISLHAQVLREGYDNSGDAFNASESILTPAGGSVTVTAQ
jgi:hypothetical protein